MIDILRPHFAALGFEIIHYGSHASVNGPDLWVKKAGGRPLSVEVKSAIKKQKNLFQTEPVSKQRLSDDLIAIICNPQYVIIEPLKDHLKCCGPSGYRQLTLVLGINP